MKDNKPLILFVAALLAWFGFFSYVSQPGVGTTIESRALLFGLFALATVLTYWGGWETLLWLRED